MGIELLRPEARMILSLKEKEQMSVKELMLISGLSYRGFYLAYTRLLKKKLIEVENDDDDRRFKRVRIAEQVAGLLEPDKTPG